MRRHAHGLVSPHNDRAVTAAGNGPVDARGVHGRGDVGNICHVQKGLRFGEIGEQYVDVARECVAEIARGAA